MQTVPAQPTDGPSPDSVLLIPAAHSELLQREFQLNTRIRFVVAGLLVVGGWGAAVMDELWAARAPLLTAVGITVALYNLVLTAVRRRFRGGWERTLVAEAGLVLHYSAVVMDVVLLALVVAVLGGVRSPFMAAFFLHLTLSCFLYPRKAAWGVVLLIVSLVVLQAALETVGVAPAQALVPGGDPSPLNGRMALEITLVYATVSLTLAALLIPSARWARSIQWTLERQRDELAERSHLRRDFLQLAVHNLRAPLAASLMHLENLRSGAGGSVSPLQKRWLERMDIRLSSLMEMLDEMQILGQTEAARLDAYAQPVDVNQLLTQLAYEYEVQAENRGLTLLLELSPEVPPVEGVPLLIREALANYVSNAVRYARAPGTVTLRTLPFERGVRVEVQDGGPGIPEAFQDQLFREFAKIPGEAAVPARDRGSGLGLSLVRRIAEAHGGAVGVETDEGSPSTFWVTFPRASEGATSEPAGRSPGSEGASPPSPVSGAPR